MTRRPATGLRRLSPARADAARQLALFSGIYGLYELVRGLVPGDGVRATQDAARVIGLERSLHVFVEPAVQAWAVGHPWLIEAADWTYLNAQFTVTAAALTFIYLRRNASFYFVRNMFIVAMLLALVAYVVFPTAPPRLMPEWGFSDPVGRFTGAEGQRGLGSVFLNPDAAIPSMHVCFALMVGGSMSRLTRHRVSRGLWWLYPALVILVVVATGNHYLVDVGLGGLTAGVAAVVSRALLARARPDEWAFGGAPAEWRPVGASEPRPGGLACR